MKTTPHLTLVGAGPGDTELITLKGLKAIRSADVILYDALVNPELLTYASDDVTKLFVGKRKDQHSFTQDQINALIVESAYTYGHVVRLKGGDPFVFGRGGEEIAHARRHKITTTIIPGVSSAIGVPGTNGIPVTHRGSSESFWVMTGTTESGDLPADLDQAASSSATVVILMGLSKLNAIREVYLRHGKPTIPIAIIQNGTLPNQQIVISTIQNSVADAGHLNAPATIVIGDVVRQYTSGTISAVDLDMLIAKAS
jgi:uroporphyrin-III C-methyltransferase